MFKKIFFGLVVVLLIGLAMITRFFLSNTSFSEKSKFFYIQSGHTAKEDVMRNLEENNILQNPASFQFLASQMNTWKRKWKDSSMKNYS